MQRSDPFVLGPSEGRPDSPSGTPFKLLAQDTAGRLSLHEWSLDPWESGPGLHAHKFDEAFYVLDGDLEIQIGEERHHLGSRHMAWVPRDTPHTFANAGSEPVTVLTIATPGGLENVFAAQAGEPAPSLNVLGVEFVGPPIRSGKAPR